MPRPVKPSRSPSLRRAVLNCFNLVPGRVSARLEIWSPVQDCTVLMYRSATIIGGEAPLLITVPGLIWFAPTAVPTTNRRLLAAVLGIGKILYPQIRIIARAPAWNPDFYQLSSPELVSFLCTGMTSSRLSSDVAGTYLAHERAGTLYNRALTARSILPGQLLRLQQRGWREHIIAIICTDHDEGDGDESTPLSLGSLAAALAPPVPVPARDRPRDGAGCRRCGAIGGCDCSACRRHRRSYGSRPCSCGPY